MSGREINEDLVEQLLKQLYEQNTPVPIQIQIFNMIVDCFRQYKIKLIDNMRIMLEIIQRDETSFTIFDRCCSELCKFVDSKSMSVKPHMEEIVNSLLNRLTLVDETKLQVLVKIIIHLTCLTDHRNSLERLLVSRKICVKHVVRVAPKTIYGLILRYPNRNIPSILRLFSPLWIYLSSNDEFLEERKTYFIELSKIGVRMKNQSIFEYLFRWLPMLGQGIKSSEDLLHTILMPMEIIWDFFVLIYPPSTTKENKKQFCAYFEMFFHVLVGYLWELNEKFDLNYFEPLVNKIFRFLNHVKVTSDRKRNSSRRVETGRYKYRVVDDEFEDTVITTESDFLLKELGRFVVILNCLLLKSHNIEFYLNFLTWILELTVFTKKKSVGNLEEENKFLDHECMMTRNTLLFISTFGLCGGGRKISGKLQSVKKKLEDVLERRKCGFLKDQQVVINSIQQKQQQKQQQTPKDEGKEDDMFLSSLLDVDEGKKKSSSRSQDQMNNFFLNYEVRMVLKCYENIVKSPSGFLSRLSSRTEKLLLLSQEEHKAQLFCPSLLVLSLGLFLSHPAFENIVMKESLGFVGSMVGHQTLSLYLQPLIVKKLRDDPKNALSYLYLLCGSLTKQGGRGGASNFFIVRAAQSLLTSLPSSLRHLKIRLLFEIWKSQQQQEHSEKIKKNSRTNQQQPLNFFSFLKKEIHDMFHEINNKKKKKKKKSEKREEENLISIGFVIHELSKLDPFQSLEFLSILKDSVSLSLLVQEENLTTSSSSFFGYVMSTFVNLIDSGYLHFHAVWKTIKEPIICFIHRHSAIIKKNKNKKEEELVCFLLRQIIQFLGSSGRQESEDQQIRVQHQQQQQSKFIKQVVLSGVEDDEDHLNLGLFLEDRLSFLQIQDFLWNEKNKGDDYEEENLEILSLLWSILEENGNLLRIDSSNNKRKYDQVEIINFCVSSISKFSILFQFYHFEKKSGHRVKKKKKEGDESEDYFGRIESKKYLIEKYLQKMIDLHLLINKNKPEEEESTQQQKKKSEINLYLSRLFQFSFHFSKFVSSSSINQIQQQFLKKKVSGIIPVQEKPKKEEEKKKSMGFKDKLSKEYLSMMYLNYNRQISTIPLFLFNIQPSQIIQYFLDKKNMNTQTFFSDFLFRDFCHGQNHSFFNHNSVMTLGFHYFFHKILGFLNSSQQQQRNFYSRIGKREKKSKQIMNQIFPKNGIQFYETIYSTCLSLIQKKKKKSLLTEEENMCMLNVLFSFFSYFEENKSHHRQHQQQNEEDGLTSFHYRQILKNIISHSSSNIFRQKTTTSTTSENVKIMERYLWTNCQLQIFSRSDDNNNNDPSHKQSSSSTFLMVPEKVNNLKKFYDYIVFELIVGRNEISHFSSLIQIVHYLNRNSSKQSKEEQVVDKNVRFCYIFILSHLFYFKKKIRFQKKGDDDEKKIKKIFFTSQSTENTTTTTKIEEKEKKDETCCFSILEERKISKFFDFQFFSSVNKKGGKNNKNNNRWKEGNYSSLMFRLFLDSLQHKKQDQEEESERVIDLIEYIIFDILEDYLFKTSKQQQETEEMEGEQQQQIIIIDEKKFEKFIDSDDHDFFFMFEFLKYVPLLLLRDQSKNSDKVLRIFGLYFNLMKFMDETYNYEIIGDPTKKKKEIYVLKNPKNFIKFHQIIGLSISSFLKNFSSELAEKKEGGGRLEKEIKMYMMEQISRISSTKYYYWIKMNALYNLTSYFLSMYIFLPFPKVYRKLSSSPIIITTTSSSTNKRRKRKKKKNKKKKVEKVLFMDIDLFLISLQNSVFFNNNDKEEEEEREDKKKIERFLYLPKFNILYSLLIKNYGVPKIGEEEKDDDNNSEKNVSKRFKNQYHKLIQKFNEEKEQDEDEDMTSNVKKLNEEEKEEISTLKEEKDVKCVGLLFDHYCPFPSIPVNDPSYFLFFDILYRICFSGDNNNNIQQQQPKEQKNRIVVEGLTSTNVHPRKVFISSKKKELVLSLLNRVITHFFDNNHTSRQHLNLAGLTIPIIRSLLNSVNGKRKLRVYVSTKKKNEEEEEDDDDEQKEEEEEERIKSSVEYENFVELYVNYIELFVKKFSGGFTNAIFSSNGKDYQNLMMMKYFLCLEFIKDLDIIMNEVVFKKIVEVCILPFVFNTSYYFFQKFMTTCSLISKNINQQLILLVEKEEKEEEEEDYDDDGYTLFLNEERKKRMMFKKSRMNFLITKIKSKVLEKQILYTKQKNNRFGNFGSSQEKFLALSQIWDWAKFCSTSSSSQDPGQQKQLSLFSSNEEENKKYNMNDRKSIKVFNQLIQIYMNKNSSKNMQEKEIITSINNVQHFIVEELIENGDLGLVNLLSIEMISHAMNSKKLKRSRLIRLTERFFLQYLEKYEHDYFTSSLDQNQNQSITICRRRRKNYQIFLFYQLLFLQSADLFASFDEQEMEKEIFEISQLHLSSNNNKEESFYFFNFLVTRFFITYYESLEKKIKNQRKEKGEQEKKKMFMFSFGKKREDEGQKEGQKDEYDEVFLRKLLVLYNMRNGRRVDILPMMVSILRSFGGKRNNVFWKRNGGMILQNYEDLVLKTIM